MKKLSVLLVVQSISIGLWAQWTDDGAKSHTLDQIGIGISDPGSYQLRVDGTVLFNDQVNFSTVSHNGTQSKTHLWFPVASDGFGILTQQLQSDRMNVIFRLRDNVSGDYFKIWFDDYRGTTFDRYPLVVSGERVFLVQEAGSVGIGTTTPSEKLEVNGTIRSKEVKVEAANWPDYVFDEDYELRSLEETESFIRAHHRLPEMPSAEQVEEEGIELGEMNRLLLEKVEELTLHVIELKKEIREAKKNSGN
ncbi:MAG: hypothetical protein KI790_11000 [Cyclobacteriaceae bacterium]|nr:hypothetical protein [Cyclobacteriaceae bacterium HetDA_MAG_MS6]